MGYYEITSPARCKHCDLCIPAVRVEGTKRMQAFCKHKDEHIALRDLVCDEWTFLGKKVLQDLPTEAPGTGDSVD